MEQLFKPYMPEELPELNSILHSNNLSYGKWGKVFEQRLGDFVGNKNILTVNSYNSAMLIALAVIGVKPGDEVIASPMSCLASNQPFVTQGLDIKWADIDPQTGTLDPISVKNNISSKTKAIFHNHFCGYPGYVDEINSIAQMNGIYVVDDAIEAFGSEYRGRVMGNLGADLTVFSFQTVRLPNCIDGGAIAFGNQELYEKGILLRDYGIERSRFRDNKGEINIDYDITNPGFGATLSELNSYIGCIQMENISDLLLKQRANAEVWKNLIYSISPDIVPLDRPDITSPNYWVFGIKGDNKADLLDKFRDKGYYASSVHLPNNYYSVFGENVILKGVNDFHAKFLAIPSGWWVGLK